MSMARGCILVEKKPGEWYAAVTHREYDYDFNPGTYTVYGPAKTEDAAFDLLSDDTSNPGGYNRMEYGTMTADDVAKLLKDGYRPQPRKMFGRFR